MVGVRESELRMKLSEVRGECRRSQKDGSMMVMPKYAVVSHWNEGDK